MGKEAMGKADERDLDMEEEFDFSKGEPNPYVQSAQARRSFSQDDARGGGDRDERDRASRAGE